LKAENPNSMLQALVRAPSAPLKVDVIMQDDIMKGGDHKAKQGTRERRSQQWPLIGPTS
jgi:hypothetical protein